MCGEELDVGRTGGAEPARGSRGAQNSPSASKTEQTAVLIWGNDGADASVAEHELREVRPGSGGLTQISRETALPVRLDENSVHILCALVS